jgi:hypothetical protein
MLQLLHNDMILTPSHTSHAESQLDMCSGSNNVVFSVCSKQPQPLLHACIQILSSILGKSHDVNALEMYIGSPLRGMKLPHGYQSCNMLIYVQQHEEIYTEVHRFIDFCCRTRKRTVEHDTLGHLLGTLNVCDVFTGFSQVTLSDTNLPAHYQLAHRTILYILQLYCSLVRVRLSHHMAKA